MNKLLPSAISAIVVTCFGNPESEAFQFVPLLLDMNSPLSAAANQVPLLKKKVLTIVFAGSPAFVGAQFMPLLPE